MYQIFFHLFLAWFLGMVVYFVDSLTESDMVILNLMNNMVIINFSNIAIPIMVCIAIIKLDDNQA